MRAALSRAVPLVAILVAAVPVAQAIPGEDPRPSLTFLDEA